MDVFFIILISIFDEDFLERILEIENQGLIANYRTAVPEGKHHLTVIV
jgi:hypothetical protein